MIPKNNKSEIRNFVTRRSKRIRLRIKFEINGRDRNGNQFEEVVETVNLSGLGGSFRSRHAIKTGSLLKLTSTKGVATMARAVWIKDDVRNLGFLVGFQLLEPNKNWVLHSTLRPSY